MDIITAAEARKKLDAKLEVYNKPPTVEQQLWSTMHKINTVIERDLGNTIHIVHDSILRENGAEKLKELGYKVEIEIFPCEMQIGGKTVKWENKSWKISW